MIGARATESRCRDLRRALRAPSDLLISPDSGSEATSAVVIDPRFEGMSLDQRDSMTEPYLKQLPDRTYGDIMTLYAFAPSEVVQTRKTAWEFAQNVEFEEPSPSELGD